LALLFACADDWADYCADDWAVSLFWFGSPPASAYAGVIARATNAASGAARSLSGRACR
jgi:hypothetical protein